MTELSKVVPENHRESCQLMWKNDWGCLMCIYEYEYEVTYIWNAKDVDHVPIDPRNRKGQNPKNTKGTTNILTPK